MTPIELQVDKNGTNPKYLNINMGHELWKDIGLDLFLFHNPGYPPFWLYFYRVLRCCVVFNVLVFGILYAACWAVSGAEARLC